MPRITNDPTRAICPSFEDPEWEFLRQSMVEAHQGDPPLTEDEAAQHMKDAWTHENQRKVTAWNAQLEQDQAEQDEIDRLAREEDDARCVQREKEAKEQREEAEKKKPKLNRFDPSLPIKVWIEPRPSTYALSRLNGLEYVELDYFTARACKEAATETHRPSNNDAMAITVTDCSAGRSGERYGPDFPVSLCIARSSEVNAPVMWCGLGHVHYDTITNY